MFRRNVYKKIVILSSKHKNRDYNTKIVYLISFVGIRNLSSVNRNDVFTLDNVTKISYFKC